VQYHSEYLPNIMAFPVPDHLPKRPTPVDVSSTILYKMDSATKDTLNSSLAASWIHELDESIQATKVCLSCSIYIAQLIHVPAIFQQSIHDRIQSDLPKFRRQLETSKSVQTQFNSLTSRVDGLNDAISNSEVSFYISCVYSWDVER
jgi:centromere/kinetochore protein ZW10